MASSTTTNTCATVFGENAQWEWLGDKNIWQQYPQSIQEHISQAFNKQKKKVMKTNDMLESVVDNIVV
jgi:hypothetical protein